MENRTYPVSPLVGVGAAVYKNGSVLLIKRGNPPLSGTWSLPGGAVHPRESLKDAIKREVHEECAVEVEVSDLIRIFEYIERDEHNNVKYHYIVFDFKAVYSRGTLSHSSDALDARWVHTDSLDSYNLTREVDAVIREGLRTK